MSGLRQSLMGGVQLLAPTSPGASKTAVCDGCGFMRSALGPFAIVSALLRAGGWFIEEDREGARCLCPGCVSRARH